jgi:hypothetical protein
MIELDGMKFYKDNKGYYRTAKIKNSERIRLHVYIYEKANNIKVPKDYDIHHKDLNKSNNEPSNLAMMTHSEHRKLHSIGKKHKLSEETKLKMSESKIGNKNALGHKHSEETKLKMSKSKKGCKCWKAKLDDHKVCIIKNLIARGFKNLEIAKIFDVDRHTISHIRHNKTWKHVKQI